MHELAVLVVIVVVALAATTMLHRLIGPALRAVEYGLLACSIAIILFVAFFVGAEVMMRYFFNSPIPGHLEGSELLLPMIVFAAFSYTQATHGNVGMDIVLDALSPAIRRYVGALALLASIFICAVLAYFSTKNAYQLWLYDDVTMTPPYFRTWPSAAAIPLGYTLVAIRMYLQILTLLWPDRFDAYEPPDAELHMHE